MSYTLSLDTSAHSATVSLSKDGKVLGTRSSVEKQKHAEFLNVAIAELLKSELVSLKEIEKILLNRGPGSFTGLRVGIAFAKAFAYTRNISIFTSTTAELLALEAGGVGYFHYKEDAQNSEYYFSVLRDLDFELEPLLLRKNVTNSLEGISELLIRSPQFKGSEMLVALFEKKPNGFKTFDWKTLTPLYLKASAAEELLILRK